MTGQERTKERLFEEEIELKWEKGGSGLVFYTDAQFWQEEEGGNAGTRLGRSVPCCICFGFYVPQGGTPDWAQ